MVYGITLESFKLNVTTKGEYTMSHKLEIERNAEGNILAYLTNESTDNGYRIAGPKGWGRTSNIATLVIHDSDLLVYLNKYAPELLENKS